MRMQHLFIHHVFFWLKDPANSSHRSKLIAGLEKLASIGTIRTCHIGMPAGTDRNVIDTTYTLSWLLTFDSREDQDLYQEDPIHLEFVEECSPLWQKVVVYDSVDVR